MNADKKAEWIYQRTGLVPSQIRGWTLEAGRDTHRLRVKVDLDLTDAEVDAFLGRNPKGETP